MWQGAVLARVSSRAACIVPFPSRAKSMMRLSSASTRPRRRLQRPLSSTPCRFASASITPSGVTDPMPVPDRRLVQLPLLDHALPLEQVADGERDRLPLVGLVAAADVLPLQVAASCLDLLRR